MITRHGWLDDAGVADIDKGHVLVVARMGRRPQRLQSVRDRLGLEWLADAHMTRDGLANQRSKFVISHG